MAAPDPRACIGEEEAAAIFAEFASADELALGFPADGCYARAHLMVKRLLAKGHAPGKVWAFAASSADLLWVDTPHHPDGRVDWVYHVAPALVVGHGGAEVQEMVLDPILFDRPVSVDTWRNGLHDTPALVRTVPGGPPIPARGGTGSWPGPDLIEGPDLHAIETLEEYRLSSN
jgi:hypothetical protein